MEYTATLMKDNRVKISISKKNLNVERIKAMVNEKLIKLESFTELKTRVIVVSEPILNYKKAIPGYPALFIVSYDMIGLGLTIEGLKEIQKFLDDKVKKLEE